MVVNKDTMNRMMNMVPMDGTKRISNSKEPNRLVVTMETSNPTKAARKPSIKYSLRLIIKI